MAATATVDIEVRGLDEARDGVSAFKGAVDILGGSVETLVGGLGLLGAEPQWLKNVEDGAVKAIAFADGISRLADGVVEVSQYLGFFNKTIATNTIAETENTTATAANTTAKATNTATTKGLDSATKAATATTRTFNKVLTAGAIGLAIAGLGAIIANFDEIMNFFKGVEGPNQALGENVRIAERNLAIAQGTNASLDRRLALQREVFAARKAQIDDEIRFARESGDTEALEAAQQKAKDLTDEIIVFTNTASFQIQELRDAAGEAIDEIANRNLDAFIDQQEEENAIIRDNTNNRLAIRRDAELSVLAFQQDRLNTEKEREQQAFQDQLDQGIINKEEFDDTMFQLDLFYADRKEQLEKESQDRITAIEVEAMNGRVDRVARGFQALVTLRQNLQKTSEDATEEELKDAFEKNKKVQIALALVQTYQAVTAALTAGGNPVKLATGAQFVEAGIALTTGLAQVAAIRNTEYQSATEEDTSSEIGSAVSAASTNLTGLNSEFNNISADILARQTAQLGGQNFLQAYVVSGDVTTAQQAEEYLNNRRVL